MKPFSLGLKTQRSKTKVSFGLENSTAVNLGKLREIVFWGLTVFLLTKLIDKSALLRRLPTLISLR